MQKISRVRFVVASGNPIHTISLVRISRRKEHEEEEF